MSNKRELDISEDSPREWTVEEVRDKFLHQVATYVTYWRTLPGKSSKERLEGLAFSMLVIFDGGTDLPGFIITPAPHSSDKLYFMQQGLNWFPESDLGVDIAGAWHETCHSYFENTPLEAFLLSNRLNHDE